jgi:hypothetical protein
MKASLLAAGLAMATNSMAAPLNARDVQKAVNDCANTANPSLCEQVVTAINGWDGSVNGVNVFLNTALSLNGQALADAKFSALRFANAEPGFLTTLSQTPNLSSAGQSAVQTLMNVFGAIPTNLQQLTQSEIFVQDAVKNINSIR